LKIGILGVGFIGKTLAHALDQKSVNAWLVALSDLDCAKAEALAAALSCKPAVLSVEEMLDRVDLVVEAASQAALQEFVPKALVRGCDMLVMSVGGLLGHEDWFHTAAEKGCRIYVPCGAIAGLDEIKSESMGRIDTATLTSRKPASALKGSKYIVGRGLQLN